jgi:putative lipoic acid-binding regulatory protein
MGAVIKTTKSKTGKFTSISIDVQMKSSQEIVDKYQEVSTIEVLFLSNIRKHYCCKQIKYLL